MDNAYENEQIETNSVENEPAVEVEKEPTVDIEPEMAQKTESYNYGNPNPDMTYHYSYVQEAQEQKEEKKEKKKKGTGKNKKWVVTICLALTFGVVASLVFQGTNRIVDGIFGKRTTNSGKTVTTTQTASGDNAGVESNVATVAKNVMPSVVSITNMSVQEVQYYFFGGTQQQETTSRGSGIIVGQSDTELLMVTNNHVIAGNTSLTVTFADEASVQAYVKGADPDIDIAVIAVPLSEIGESTLDAVKVATLGDSNALAVGETAIAIGNALGYGQSVTVGIVSALQREIEDFDTKLIQTDAAINPGNSGGALLNAKGEVIGINTVKVNANAVEGMGYAIPISDVNDIINEMMNRQTRQKVAESEQGALGITGINVTEQISELYGIPQGVQISELIKGGAAEKAGLPKKGILVKFDGNRVGSMEELQGYLQYYEKGEKVKVVVAVANGEGEYVEKTYEVTLSPRTILQE